MVKSESGKGGNWGGKWMHKLSCIMYKWKEGEVFGLGVFCVGKGFTIMKGRELTL
ncbi:hypothetical protein HanIR_Chr17g0888101 [Helianthus annuus]|nr:hypothetical protein HanIR_Chr17g0888101 [Helianthus annuus]